MRSWNKGLSISSMEMTPITKASIPLMAHLLASWIGTGKCHLMSENTDTKDIHHLQSGSLRCTIHVQVAFTNDLELTLFELALIGAYKELGRPDLAEYVRQGKKYQHLYNSRGMHHRPEVTELHWARKGFCPADPGPEEVPESWAVWVDTMKVRYKDDQGLAKLLEESKRFEGSSRCERDGTE